MIEFVEKALNVRRNEFGPAFLLFAYLFAAIGAYYIATSVGDAMFLKAYGKDNLPYVIIATAVVVGTFASIYIRLSNRMRVQYLMFGALVFLSGSFGLFWWITHFQVKLVYGLIYVWTYMLGAIAPTIGWTMANFVLTTREARRIFGFVGAGGALGAPCAAFLTAALVHRHIVKPETMLLGVTLGAALCSVLVMLTFRRSRERVADVAGAASAPSDLPKNFLQIWKYIRGSRYLVLITALIAVGCATTTLIGYQYKAIVNLHFGADEVAMTTFFARFNGYTGIAAFILQMLLTGTLLRKLGIRITIFVLPVVFLGGSMGVLLAPVLLSAIILKGSHSLLRFSLDKSTAELLYLPVAPPEIKNKIKSFIDGFVWRSADGVAGAVLLFVANKMHASPGQVSLVNFVFISGWIAIAYGVRREYLNVLRRAIERRTLDPDRIATEVLDSTTTEVLAMSLERGGEQEVMYGLSLLEVGREPGWHPALRGLLDHPSPAVRQRALQLLSDAADKKIQPKVEQMLGDDSPEVRAEALHYLVAHTGRDPLTLMTSDTNLPDRVVSGAVVTYLARTDQADNRAAGQVIFETMLSATGPDAVRSRVEAARVLAVVPPDSELQGHLLELIRDEDPAVQEQAVLAAGKTQNRDALHLIIHRLGDPHLLAAARTALAEYGERALGTLQDHLNDSSVPMSVRKQIPKVLARIATPQAAAVLSNCLLQNDPGLRYELLKALNKLRSLDSGLVPPNAQVEDMLNAELMGYYRSFQILAAIDPQSGSSLGVPSGPAKWDLLARAMRERMDHELERIFRLLGLLYPPRDIHNAYAGLTSGQPRIRSNAVEVLEHLVRSDLYRTLVCALDPDVSLKDKLQFAQRLCHTSVTSKAQALRVALYSEDRWLRACAMYSIGEMQMMELYEELRRVPHADDPLLDETWNWASTRLQASAPA
jgi:ATP:ADP antiporter, AAA family